MDIGLGIIVILCFIGVMWVIKDGISDYLEKK